MKKATLLLLFLAGVILAAAFTFAMAKPREPSYRGHSLSYWLSAPESVDNTLAIDAIGTNAIPVVLAWISYEPPAWRRTLASVALKHHHRRISNILNPPGPATDALKVFSLLRTNALPALPALAKLAEDTKHPQAATQATYALCLLGPQALPCLVSAMSSTNTMIRRDFIVSAIGNIYHAGGPTSECLPALLNATTDSDPRVRMLARRFVREMAPNLRTNRPPN